MPDILAGRAVVDAYRAAHVLLYTNSLISARDIPDAHTPLLNTMLAELKKQGFNSLDEFFTASENLNKQQIALGVLTADKVWK